MRFERRSEMEENITYKGKREIRFEEDVSPFSVLAAKNILNEKQEDFDLAVIEYADDDCIDITIDGEERTIYYAETDDGIAFEMIDSDEYDDIMTDYSEYDEDDDEDDEDEDDLLDRYDDDMEGGVLDSVYFAIAFPVILDQVGIDPEKDKLELLYATEEEIGLSVNGRDAEIRIDPDSEEIISMVWIDEEEDSFPEKDENGDDNPDIIPFSNHSFF